MLTQRLAASGAGSITIEKAGGPTREKRTFSRAGGMCARCEGTGSVTDFDLSQLYDDSKSLNEGALTIPGYSMDGWYGRIFRGCGFFDPDKPIRRYTKKEMHDFLYREPVKVKVNGVNVTGTLTVPNTGGWQNWQTVTSGRASFTNRGSSAK